MVFVADQPADRSDVGVVGLETSRLAPTPDSAFLVRRHELSMTTNQIA